MALQPTLLTMFRSSDSIAVHAALAQIKEQIRLNGGSDIREEDSEPATFAKDVIQFQTDLSLLLFPGSSSGH